MAEVEPKNSPEIVKKFTDTVTTYKIGGAGKKEQGAALFQPKNKNVKLLTDDQLEHITKYVLQIKKAVREGRYEPIEYIESKTVKAGNQQKAERDIIEKIQKVYIIKGEYNPFKVDGLKIKEEEEASAAAGGPYVPTKKEMTARHVKGYEKAIFEEELEAHHVEMKKIFNDKGDLTADELYKKALMRINPNSPKLNPMVDQLLQPHVDKEIIKAEVSKKESVNPEMVLDTKQKKEVKTEAPRSAFMPELKQTDDIFLSAEVGNKHVVPKPQVLLEPRVPDDELNMAKNTMSAVPENKDIVFQPLEPTHEPAPEPSKVEGQIVNIPSLPSNRVINPSMQSSNKPSFQQFMEGVEQEEQGHLEAKPTIKPVAGMGGNPQAQSQAQILQKRAGRGRPPIFAKQPIASNVLQQPEMMTPGVGVNAQQLAAIMRATQDHINAAEVEARAGREYDKTIGERSRTGLSANDAVPKADILIKEAKDKKKSLDSFANLSWVESSFGDSKLGRKSSLQKMKDKEDKIRYGYTFFNAPKQLKRRCDIYDDNYEYIKNNFENRYTAVYGSRDETARHPIYERQNNAYGLRPVGARPFKLDDMGSWTYNYRGVVGTQQLGLAPMYNPTKLKDFQNDTAYYPDTIMRIGGGSALEDDFHIRFN